MTSKVLDLVRSGVTPILVNDFYGRFNLDELIGECGINVSIIERDDDINSIKSKLLHAIQDLDKTLVLVNGLDSFSEMAQDAFLTPLESFREDKYFICVNRGLSEIKEALLSRMMKVEYLTYNDSHTNARLYEMFCGLSKNPLHTSEASFKASLKSEPKEVIMTTLMKCIRDNSYDMSWLTVYDHYSKSSSLSLHSLIRTSFHVSDHN